MKAKLDNVTSESRVQSFMLQVRKYSFVSIEYEYIILILLALGYC